MPERSAEVQRAYNVWARQYDTNANATRDLNAQVLRRQSFDLAGKSVLEIGCGTGLNTIWLAERARLVLALDFSEGMLHRARRRLGAANVRFVRADVTRPWPLACAFHVVVANLVLEHVQRLGPIFEQAHHALRPGGVLYLGELHPYRQLLGSQAKYRAETGEEVLVPAFRHSVSEYTNGAIAAGFALRRLGEHRNETDRDPRLLTLRFERS